MGDVTMATPIFFVFLQAVHKHEDISIWLKALLQPH